MGKELPFWARYPDWSFHFESRNVTLISKASIFADATCFPVFLLHFITAIKFNHLGIPIQHACVMSDGSLCPKQAMEELLDTITGASPGQV